MRVPDRPSEDTNAYGLDGRRAGWDRRARSDGLVERLTRLLAGHPSADRPVSPDWRDWGSEDLELDDLDADDPYPEDPDDLDAEDLDLYGLTPDDPESEDIGTEGSPGVDVAGGFRQRRTADVPWDGAGGDVRSAYRPWFAADGAGDPWFTEPTDWTSE